MHRPTGAGADAEHRGAGRFGHDRMVDDEAAVESTSVPPLIFQGDAAHSPLPDQSCGSTIVDMQPARIGDPTQASSSVWPRAAVEQGDTLRTSGENPSAYRDRVYGQALQPRSVSRERGAMYASSIALVMA
jgi:hypothetical protein